MKILIAYDGSEPAGAVLEDLQRAGLPTGSEALVMSVADVFVPPAIAEEVDAPPMYVPDSIKRAHQRAQHELDRANEVAKTASKQIAAAFPTWRLSYLAEADSPAWALIRKADEWEPDLIVMGARGHSVLGGRLILGSISQRVLYEVRSSVRIARYSDTAPDKPVRILVGVDGSSDSSAAVTAVCDRSWPKGTEVALLAVVDTVMPVPSASVESSAVKWIEVADESNWNQVRAIFEPWAERIRSAGLHAEVLIRRGDPADGILDEAHTWGAGCIVVGAKGTRGIARLMLGSVSSAVAARAHCSVEVVR